MIDLRAFAFIDQLQKQMVAYIGSKSDRSHVVL